MARTDVDKLVDSFRRLVRLAQEEASASFVKREEELFEKYAKKLELHRGVEHVIERNSEAGDRLKFERHRNES